ncbi:MAG: ABC transporter ATP-binding protein [Bacteriovoracaceae bacterium]|nr:ABC transporter ATP-binding protein [Bacteriovoracaceae bacterium]
MVPTFEVTNLSKVYGKCEQTKVKALKELSFKIMPGEFTAIVGPSGSGKSTLLNIMSGLDYPSEGMVHLAGQDISHMSGNELSDYRRDHIGFVFQAYNLIPVLTVKENVEYILQLQAVNANQRKKRVAQILEEVGLAGFEKRFPMEISGGQKQRVAVARAIVSNPDIVLADEPTANLDSKTGVELVAMMSKLNETHGTTFIFSTHDPTIMERSKRLIVLKDGQIVKDQ